VVIPPISVNELAAHETHVGLKGKCSGDWPLMVWVHAADCSPTHEVVEIGDRGRLDAKSREKTWRSGPSGPSSCRPPGMGSGVAAVVPLWP